MQLTDNFSLEELCFSEIATRKGIANDPTPDEIENLKILAQSLERIQKLFGHPIRISSGYRGQKVNAAIGGSTTSAHMEGYAADFTCPSFGTPLEVCKAIAASDLSFDQLIQEGTWAHLSIDPRMRRELLTATFSGGKATYSVTQP